MWPLITPVAAITAPSVTLIIGGAEFETTLTTLNRFPASLLGVLAAHLAESRPQPSRTVSLDRDPVMFAHVLAYLRSGVLPRLSIASQRRQLLEEAKYFRLPELERAAVPTPSFYDEFGDEELDAKIENSRSAIQAVKIRPSFTCISCIEMRNEDWLEAGKRNGRKRERVA